jgi:hypothetical protein
LDGEKLMANVRGRAFVPVFFCHFAPIMAIIARRIVDQYPDWPDLFTQERNRRFQRINIAQITFCEMYVSAQFIGQSLTRGFIQIQKSNARTLCCKSTHNVGTNARCPT